MRAAARAKPKLRPPLRVQPPAHGDALPAGPGRGDGLQRLERAHALQGDGDGTTYLVRYLVYGGVGFVALHVIARRGLDSVVALTGPLLAFSFACLVAVKLPGLGVTVNGARRWLGAGPADLPALRGGQARARPLRGEVPGPEARAHPHAARRSCRCCWWPARRCCSSPPSPTSGTALVIAFTLTALLVAGGFPVRYLLIGAGAAAFLVTALRDVASPTGARG